MPKRQHRKHLPPARTEPAMIRGVIMAIIAALGAFGVTVHVTGAQVTALTVLIAAAIPLIQAIWTRVAVTANAKVIARVTTHGAVVAGDAAVSPTGSELPTSDRGDGIVPTLNPVRIQAGLVE